MQTVRINKKAFGDFQTPLSLCRLTCQKINELFPDFVPDIVIEPTCGCGNFLRTANLFFSDANLFGLEINKDKAAVASAVPQATVTCDDFFHFSWDAFVSEETKQKKYLLLGNPPWVTNSDLSQWNIHNLPKKKNYKSLSGLDAITGSANFDICEYIIFDLLFRFRTCQAAFAFLCKSSVAVKLYQEIKKYRELYRDTYIFSFDSKKYFDISADACLFVVAPERKKNLPHCLIGKLEEKEITWKQMGYIDGRFYGNLQKNGSYPDGESCFEWRQGVKHDCSSVMELTHTKVHTFTNKLGEEIELEDEIIFPLFKGSQLKQSLMTDTLHSVIVPQKYVGQDTGFLEHEYPMIWKYLNSHVDLFERRKSSIYKKGIPFSVFGVGSYSFSRYKVAISGFYHEPLFVLADTAKPAMFDDTCYFLSFDDYSIAYTCMLILNSSLVHSFLRSLVAFAGKRPFTKKILQRIDFRQCHQKLSYQDLKETEQKLNLPDRFLREDYMNFFAHVTSSYLF